MTRQFCLALAFALATACSGAAGGSGSARAEDDLGQRIEKKLRDLEAQDSMTQFEVQGAGTGDKGGRNGKPDGVDKPKNPSTPNAGWFRNFLP